MHNVAFFPSLPLAERQKKNEIKTNLTLFFFTLSSSPVHGWLSRAIHKNWVVEQSLPLLIPAYCNSGALGSRTANMFPLWNQTPFFLTHFPGVVPYTHWLCNLANVDSSSSKRGSDGAVWITSIVVYALNPSSQCGGDYPFPTAIMTIFWAFPEDLQQSVCRHEVQKAPSTIAVLAYLPSLHSACFQLPLLSDKTLRQVKPQEIELPRLRKHCLSSLPN